MNKNLFLTLGFCLTVFASFAQKTIIRGQVIDDENGEPLIGATVIIVGTTVGAATDLDGKYTIDNVNAGTYDLQCSYVSFQNKIVKGFEVKAGQVNILNIRLKTESVGLQEVVVQAEAIRNNEAALLTVQRNSAVVLDGISAEQFSKLGDNDAAAAMRRVTGVSVEGGKYVFVRGLGDRYSKTALNSAEIPGLDANRNTVQMDLFPSNLIDNIVVYKTFSPELPASFAGGFVNITTKDFPEKFTMQISGSLSYNTQTTYNSNFQTQENVSTVALGFDDGTRDIPDEVVGGVPQIHFTNSSVANELDRDTKAFKTGFGAKTKTPFLNNSLSFSIGNQINLFGKPFGYIGGFTYQRSFDYYQNGKIGRYILTSVNETGLDTLFSFKDTRSNESTLWGALVNATYKLNNYNKIGINLIRNQSADVTTRFIEGFFPYENPERDTELQNRSLQYIQRSMSSGQVRGEHAVPNKIKVDWLSSYTISTQDEPDLRFFNNGVKYSAGDPSFYFTHDNNTRNPTRYYRYLDEFNLDNKVNIELPFTFLGGKKSKAKIGGAYLMKERSFDERIFELLKSSSGSESYEGDIDKFFREENLGVTATPNGSGTYKYGLYLTEILNTGGSYTGEENLPAVYAMVDLQVTPKLKISTGARYEGTDIKLTNDNENLVDSIRYTALKTQDILPALNITQELISDMNLRFGYGRTVARPTFRELANYATFDFLLDFFLVGNSQLERTLIDNFDFRWEYYPTKNEYLSVSAFYKKFQNPIEKAFDPLKQEPKDQQVNFVNVGNAQVIGMEFEVRKDLSFISDALRNYRVGANVSLIDSKVDIDDEELAIIRSNDTTASGTRSLYGQAPYIVNAQFGYDNPEKRFSYNLVYNISGSKLYVISNGITPDVYEEPRGMLDFNFSKGIGNRFSVKVRVQNILDPEFKYEQKYKGDEYNYQSYKIGRSFSFGLSYLIE